MKQPIGLIIITHGELSSVLFETSFDIIGDYNNYKYIELLGVRGKNIEQYKELLSDAYERLIEKGSDKVIIFSDMIGSSCTNAGKVMFNSNKNVALIAGVNLPMVINFIYHQNDYEFEELVEKIINSGVNQIKRIF